MARKTKQQLQEPVVVDKMPDIDGTTDIDDSECENIRLPPMPVPIRPYSDKDNRYKGEQDHFRNRIAHKLYSLWVLWAVMRMSPELKQLLDQECDKSSDTYETKCVLVDTMDALGKLLGDTNIIEELAWLSHDNEKEFLQQLKLSREKAKEQSQTPTETTT